MSIGCYPIPAQDDWLRAANVDRVANTMINLLLRGFDITQNHPTEVMVGIEMHKFWAVVNARVDQEK
jgi:hypothetical protein